MYKIAILCLVALANACAGSSPNDPNSVDSSLGGANNAEGGAQAAGGAATGEGGKTVAGGASATGGASNSAAPTWTQLWTNYFQGQCASCHQSSGTVGVGKTFANAVQLCSILTDRGQLNGTTNPPLISASTSSLVWFNKNGTMPLGATTAPGNAVNDIKAWATAGAVCP
jgi:hypothetical protein